MRYLVFLRGIPGSGKSTFVKENRIEPYTISSDQVRLLLKPPVLSVTGQTTISQKINRRVWGLIYSLIKCRMEEGEFTILDATNAGNADLAKYRQLVKAYRYKAFCVDFSDVPLEVAKERNMKRPAYEVVPEAVIEDMHSIISRQSVPSFVSVIKPYEFHEKLQYRVTDFSHYRTIHHIGDINGSYTALMKYLACGLNDSDLYIFLGDYAGDGAENARVIKFLISVMCRDNVVLLEGDNEKCLCNPTGEEQTHISEFGDTLYLLPELDQAGITKNDALELYRKTVPCIYYKFHTKHVLVTHGGLSSLPENLVFIGTEQMIKGVGEPEDASLIAESFNKNTGENTFQIHSHRNPENLPVENGRTFNLCDENQNGKSLRVLTLNNEGFHDHYIRKEN
ncbi:AAA family ATPase [Methanosarcina sp. DH2]|uniref:AAA family ATPase n=1 Tax=Methanosarcina sp. DH2 TaxID=2605639 RepID=UPI001E45ED61|nr:AAA family ATPase [Methanosarcina sp. DH2]MCC4771733.1 AAA family ATPase [Methanosarcina sp. DH2]